MSLQEIKELILKTIEDNKENIIRIGEEILKNPETGYREDKTSALVRDVFDSLSIDYQYPLAKTAVKATLGKKEGKPNVCIIGELDAVICNGHPNATSTGAAHACGHHAQIAAMLGAAIALKKSGVIDNLDGNVTFFAVPAEEFIELDYRKSLKDKGEISYYGGKQELIANGAFDDIDIALMMHAEPDSEKNKVYVRGHNLGFLAKTITFRGKAAHGSMPFEGTNALNAAALSILGIHSNRETFKDEDRIRIHPIITKGGDVVNSVPDEVCIDTYVRGATFDAIKKGNAAVCRSVSGAAQMIGATVETEDIPGYLPLCESIKLSEVFESVCEEIIGRDNLIFGGPITGSSDIGDLSYVLPTIQPSVSGFYGTLHSKEFVVSDNESAYILPVKLMALTVATLLYNNAEKANDVIKQFKPQLTKEQYINYLKGE